MGGFFLKAGNSVSPSFQISPDVYKGTADLVLNYMRQQRCGFNPYLNDSCHTHDGIIVDHPTKTGQHIDVIGGWHDASDYLQYTTTSANAIYQLLFAYQQNPSVYGDKFAANGGPGANGIPDILDEARWGLEWLLKMNPAKNEMYNQIADDRDHAGFRIPTLDTLGGYGLGVYRPVYFVTGKSQGLGKYKNRSTGVSSTAAKFSSSFALGASVFKHIDPTFAEQMLRKSRDAWDFAKSDLGNFQTACMVSPYFYEEDNWVDDMELAAATLIPTEKQIDFQKEAKYWGELEPVTPWMELNRAPSLPVLSVCESGTRFIGAVNRSGHCQTICRFNETGTRSNSEICRQRSVPDWRSVCLVFQIILWLQPSLRLNCTEKLPATILMRKWKPL